MSGLLGDIEDFFQRREDDLKVDLHGVAHALEDLPADARAEGEKILSTPSGTDLQHRIFDVLENAVVDAYGHAELLETLRFLASYPVKAYTYQVSPSVSRGERADAAKMKRLAAQGFTATINLCAELPKGDTPVIATAGLTGKMLTHHVGIVDMNPPTVAQVMDYLETVTQLVAAGHRVYVHCEAGKSRTGVIIACHRMALMGWSAQDALTEAKNFGCSVPMQQAFIEDFARKLDAQWKARDAGAPLPFPALKGYPALRPGSVRATPRELSATLDSVTGGSGLI